MEGQQLGQDSPPLAPGDDPVQKAVVQQILGPLKALGQLLLDGLLNDPRPGKTDEGPGSESMMSPRDAKLAVTPPVVGWVKQEMYSPPPLWNRRMAAAVFAICIREKIPSCIRAPPLAEKIIRGSFFRAAYSAARVTFSPTAVPMLPMRKRLSSTAKTARQPSILPRAATAASFRPVDCSSSDSFAW